LKNEVIMRRIVCSGRTNPQPAGHPQVENQHAVRMQADQEVFGTPVNPGNGPPHRLGVQGFGIHHMAQARLPHPHPDNGVSNQPCR
jgi:hypothetical protein